MAPYPQGSTEALIARIDAARGVLGAEMVQVRQRLNFPARVKQAVLSKPLAWLGGSAVAGLAASLLLRRRRRPEPEAPKKQRGFLGFILGSAFSLARPALEAWAMKHLRDRFSPPPAEPWPRD